MLTGRLDIIGDLARLRNQFVGATNQSDDVLNRLEVLAAAAVSLGMSYTIVGKASGIPRPRIDSVIESQSDDVDRCADDYERKPTGTVMRRDR